MHSGNFLCVESYVIEYSGIECDSFFSRQLALYLPLSLTAMTRRVESPNYKLYVFMTFSGVTHILDIDKFFVHMNLVIDSVMSIAGE